MYIPPIRIGDSITLEEVPSYTDPASDAVLSGANGWTLKLYIKGSSNNAVFTADSSWVFALTAINTATLFAGFAQYALVATKALEVVTIDTGRIEVLPSLVSAAGTFEYRSQDRIDLDLVVAAIRALTTNAVQEYSIGGRTLKKADLPDLIARESQLRVRVKKEEHQQKINQGEPDPRISRMRFR